MYKTLKKHILLSVIVAVLMSSCITARQLNYMQQAGLGIEQYADTVPFRDYRFKAGDYLFISVFSTEKQMTDILNGSAIVGGTGQRQDAVGDSPGSELYTYQIDTEGNIEFSPIGTVHLDGLTIREANRKIEEGLSKILTSYSVEIQMVKKYFSVIGESAGGRFTITREKLNVFEALAMTGDLGLFSNRAKIHLIREKNGQTLIKTFDLRSVDIINSEFYYIEPNDILYIPTLREEFFGITSFGTMLSMGMTAVTFGLWVYKIAKGGIKF